MRGNKMLSTIGINRVNRFVTILILELKDQNNIWCKRHTSLESNRSSHSKLIPVILTKEKQFIAIQPIPKRKQRKTWLWVIWYWILEIRWINTLVCNYKTWYWKIAWLWQMLDPHLRYSVKRFLTDQLLTSVTPHRASHLESNLQREFSQCHYR